MTRVTPHHPAESVVVACGALWTFDAIITPSGDAHFSEIGEIAIAGTLKAVSAVGIAVAFVAQDAAAVAGPLDTGGPLRTQVSFIGGAVTVIVLTVTRFVDGHTHPVDAAAIHAGFRFATALSEVVWVSTGVHPPYIAFMAGQGPPKAFRTSA